MFNLAGASFHALVRCHQHRNVGGIMDLKLAFLTLAAAALSFHTEIDRQSVDSFSAVAYQRFPVRQTELYHLVTFPDIADQWLKWMSHFASADHRALGVGKMYKAIIKNYVMHFRVTEFTAGRALVMESNFIFRPRVELRFSELPPFSYPQASSVQQVPSPKLQHNATTPDACSCGYLNVSGSSGIGEISGSTRTNVRGFLPCTNGTIRSGSRSSSKLIIKLYFQRHSLMFQYTLGTILRSIFEYELRESMQNLLAIVLESTTCPNVFVLH